MAEEFHHPQYLVVDPDGKGEGAVEIRLHGERSAGKVGVLHHVEDRDWFAVRPDQPGQADATPEGGLHGHPYELRCVH